MGILIFLICASFFSNEYFILNDELVLYMLAFVTQALIVNSLTHNITELQENTTDSIMKNYSANLNEKEGSLSNSSLNALVITGKILNISTCVLQASTKVTGGSCQPIKIDLNAFSPK